MDNVIPTMAETPAAKPSNPSVIFAPLDTDTIINMTTRE